MKSFLPIILRLLLLGGVGSAVYIFVAKPQNLPAPVKTAVDLSTTQVNSVLAAVDQNEILSKAGDKLTKPQPIINDTSLNKSEVKGVSTDQVTQEAKKIIDTTVSQVSQELQNLPKKEAAKILRQTCEQIAADLEK